MGTAVGRGVVCVVGLVRFCVDSSTIWNHDHGVFTRARLALARCMVGVTLPITKYQESQVLIVIPSTPCV